MFAERKREKRACPSCGFERVVLVWYRDGVEEFDPPLCGACKLRQKAARYRTIAWDYEQRALVINTRRKKAP
jgi:hypothetical protein